MKLLLKDLLFTAVVPGTVAVYVPLQVVRGLSPGTGVTVLVACVLFGIGTAVYLWCIWDFATFGHGTPAPIDAPRKLVVRGLYRFTRNPMYIGVLTVIVGWAILFRSATLTGYAVSVGACFHLFVVLYEERRLRRAFGDSYDEYLARVNRWLPRRPLRPMS